MDIQVSEAKELAWRISMTSRLQKLMGKQCVCLEYLMVRFFSHHKFEIIDSFIKIHVEISVSGMNCLIYLQAPTE